jgi:hypothetical protein
MSATVVNVGLILLLVLAVLQVALILRKMETDSRQRRQQMVKLEADQERLSRATEDFRYLLERTEKELQRVAQEIEKAKTERDAGDAEVKRIQGMPKERLIVADKSTIQHPKLWEVEVTNDQFIRSASGTNIAAAEAWQRGRICLIGASTERDARHRGESKYPASLGYRINRVHRFRRGAAGVTAAAPAPAG